jgi:hypothetical protein
MADRNSFIRADEALLRVVLKRRIMRVKHG